VDGGARLTKYSSITRARNINGRPRVVGTYYCPHLTKYEEFVDYIQELPLITHPNIFGMNDNADLIKEQQETETLLTSVLSTQVRERYNNPFRKRSNYTPPPYNPRVAYKTVDDGRRISFRRFGRATLLR